MKKLSVRRIWAIGAVLFIGLVAFNMINRPNAKYKITTENSKTYYANTFRVYGKGIIFDDIKGSTIIVQGDLEIEKMSRENE